MPANGKQNALNHRQRRAIEALLLGQSKGMAATAAGVTGATLSRWLREDPDFRNQLSGLSDLALKDAAIRLKSTLDMSVEIMQETMQSETVHPSVRLRAADMAASHAIKLLEVADLVERVEALEQRL